MNITDFCNKHGILWQPVDITLQQRADGKTEKIYGTFETSPLYQKYKLTAMTTDFAKFSPDIIKQRQALLHMTDFIAIDTNVVNQIDIDEEVPDEFESLIYNTPHYKSITKGLPHIFVNIDGFEKNKTKHIIDGDKTLEYMCGQWCLAHKDAVVENSNKDIMILTHNFVNRLNYSDGTKTERETHIVNYDDITNEYDKLLNVIGGARCGEGDETKWISVAQALKNDLSADEAKQKFVDWTFKYGTENKKKEASDKIDRHIKPQAKTNKDRFTIKQLHIWAKHDNPVGYEKAFKNANIDIPEKEKLIFNPVYFHSLSTYQQRKQYFEHFICKIIRPDVSFVFEETIDGNKKLCFYTENGITAAFKQLKSGDIAKNGEEMKFISKWLNDENIRYYNNMDFKPFNPTRPLKYDLYNLFTGFNKDIHASYTKDAKDKILKPFKDLGLALCGNDHKGFDYFYKFLAHIIQYPEKKLPIAFIFKGVQGTGKNVFLNAFGNIIGKQHYISSSNPKDFFGDYAEGFYHKLLVNMNECEGKDTFELEGRIKTFITEDRITVNKKYCHPIEIDNLSRIIFFTNKPNGGIPIDFKSKERRLVVYETSDEYATNKKYGTVFWKKLIEHFNKADFVAALYDDLMSIDIVNYDWKANRPITPAYLQLIKIYVPSEILFLQHKSTEQLNLLTLKDTFDEENKPTSKIEITMRELFTEFISYCKDNGFKAAESKNIKSLENSIISYNLPIKITNPQNIKTLTFDANFVLDAMKERHYIDYADDENRIMNEHVDVEGDSFDDYFNF